MEDAIEIITKLMIKEHFENEEEIIKISKVNLMKFCIKLLKMVKSMQ